MGTAGELLTLDAPRPSRAFRTGLAPSASTVSWICDGDDDVFCVSSCQVAFCHNCQLIRHHYHWATRSAWHDFDPASTGLRDSVHRHSTYCSAVLRLLKPVSLARLQVPTKISSSINFLPSRSRQTAWGPPLPRTPEPIARHRVVSAPLRPRLLSRWCRRRCFQCRNHCRHPCCRFRSCHFRCCRHRRSGL